MKCFSVPGLNWARTPLAELTAERLVLSSLPLPSWHGSRGRREEEEGRGKCLQLMIGIKSNQDRGRVRLRLLLVARRDRSWLWRPVLDLQRGPAWCRPSGRDGTCCLEFDGMQILLQKRNIRDVRTFVFANMAVEKWNCNHYIIGVFVLCPCTSWDHLKTRISAELKSKT